jgi:hypothetical protein
MFPSMANPHKNRESGIRYIARAIIVLFPRAFTGSTPVNADDPVRRHIPAFPPTGISGVLVDDALVLANPALVRRVADRIKGILE